MGNKMQAMSTVHCDFVFNVVGLEHSDVMIVADIQSAIVGKTNQIEFISITESR
jgi:hypothetical protein